jgi:hypothetical protein
MLIHLHKQATPTPKVRAAIQASVECASALAERFGTTEQTVCKWKHRDTVHDRSHTPHRLQTTLTPAQEAAGQRMERTSRSANSAFGSCDSIGMAASKAGAPCSIKSIAAWAMPCIFRLRSMMTMAPLAES